MRAKRDAIISFCCDYLKVQDFQDYCVNGMQIEGAPEVSRIVAGVSISERLIEEAIKRQAQMIIVHHGFFRDQIPSPISLKGTSRNRLKLLLANDITLCGFHLPLDAHPVIGNNASLSKLFGVRKLKTCDVGFVGELAHPVELKRFVETVNKKLETHSFVIEAGSKNVKRVAIISGGGAAYYEHALNAGADTFITGEPRESTIRAIEESELNFIAAGHYNTERLGIQNLANLVAKKFKVEAKWIDVPCEV